MTQDSQQRYTVEQAAGKLGVRADDLQRVLSDAGIDITAPGHENGTISAEEFTRLGQMTDTIGKIHQEGLYTSDE